AAALRHVRDCGLAQGLLADAQCFTAVQLRRGLAAEDPAADLDELLDPGLRTLSYEQRGRKPSERLFRQALAALAERGLTADRVLHGGSRVQQAPTPPRRFGMKTALFAGDRASLQATPEQLKDPPGRPDVLLTELGQIAEVVGRP